MAYTGMACRTVWAKQSAWRSTTSVLSLLPPEVYIVMAYMVMANMVMAYVVVADIVVAHTIWPI